MTTETALTLPERESVALGDEKTNSIRQRIDAYVYHMADEELTKVLNFIIDNGLHMETAA